MNSIMIIFLKKYLIDQEKPFCKSSKEVLNYFNFQLKDHKNFVFLR